MVDSSDVARVVRLRRIIPGTCGGAVRVWAVVDAAGEGNMGSLRCVAG